MAERTPRKLERALLLPMLLAAAGGELRAAQPAPTDVAPAPGETRVGPYRLVAELGRGGMGTVHLAEQTAPVVRAVALKIVHDDDHDPGALVERFLLERQLLAACEHEHVARLYDAGTTADGRPWFAMELVPGEPLTAYCDARRLDLPARLELFATVCEAVQHLHDVGIQHRDLKPDNVLVVDRAGRAVPKIIDLGLSAVTGSEGDGDAGGTPTHMAPEQFTLPSHRVDRRADVHALGVMLCELLVGTLPFGAGGADGSGGFRLGAGRPEAPSARLADGDAARIATLRRTTPRRLRRALRGGLDALVGRAVAADRERRPPSAAALAAEVRALAASERPRTFARTGWLWAAVAAAAGFAAGGLLA